MRSVVFAGALLAAGASLAFASETKRDLAAHEHGVGKLNIAFEKGRIAMELEVPGSDIVGFEHPAETAADRKKIDAAIAILAKPLDIFSLPADAKCQVREANVELHGGDRKGHDEHKHEEAGHDEHHDDDEHHAGKEQGHTEFHAEFVLSCANPSAVRLIEFPYFSTFPNARELEVQMISDKGSTAFEVKRDKPRLDLSGMI
jgi:hypothetical protein